MLGATQELFPGHPSGSALPPPSTYLKVLRPEKVSLGVFFYPHPLRFQNSGCSKSLCLEAQEGEKKRAQKNLCHLGILCIFIFQSNLLVIIYFSECSDSCLRHPVQGFLLRLMGWRGQSQFAPSKLEAESPVEIPSHDGEGPAMLWYGLFIYLFIYPIITSPSILFSPSGSSITISLPFLYLVFSFKIYIPLCLLYIGRFFFPLHLPEYKFGSYQQMSSLIYLFTFKLKKKSYFQFLENLLCVLNYLSDFFLKALICLFYQFFSVGFTSF